MPPNAARSAALGILEYFADFFRTASQVRLLAQPTTHVAHYQTTHEGDG